tara:strand:+ start:18333 stop:20114 length:1782 start_codon:yes stop_codon:yes gene_type:complete
MRAEHLLQSAVTLHEAPMRTNALPELFDCVGGAVNTMTDVLLHEARECMQQPLPIRPDDPYHHPVDVDTSEPGIVSSKTSLDIIRMKGDEVRRIGYHTRSEEHVPETAEDEIMVVVHKTKTASERDAEKKLSSAIRRGEKSAQTEERQRERKREREEETPEVRERRLQEQREKREERRRTRETVALDTGTQNREGVESVESVAARASKSARPSDPFPDASLNSVLQRPRSTARTRGNERFYEHPLPHHRHLAALHHASPHESLQGALLRAESSEFLEVIQGPPGTGKTMRLVQCIQRLTGRVLLCAPTNVGAANLYERCVKSGYASECALTLAPGRLPPGTAVQSNDPTRRIVCATISSRSGPVLDNQCFENVLVDEAAQCMEAWIWTLLRSDVTFLALAGDVHQLPAVVSESGRTLRHDRSLMERLVVKKYDNVTSLTEQNRMCPEILKLTNQRFYNGQLTCGPHAPTSGLVEIVDVNGEEVLDGTSYYNPMEVQEVQKICQLTPNTTVLCPYTAQCRRILALGLSVAVHTIDSFQGREADTVVVSLVRDGTSGLGFWSDYRRFVVALTRARCKLVIVVSRRSSWPILNDAD